MALINGDSQTVLYAPDDLTVPAAVLNGLSRAQQQVRVRHWECYRLLADNLWLALPPSLTAAGDEIHFLKNQLNWIEGRDALSGLMTRSAWYSDRADMTHDHYLVAYVRITNLSKITEQFGTRSGDIVLQTMGGRLALLCDGQSAARVGNDAFHWRTPLPGDLTEWFDAAYSLLAQPAHLEFGTSEIECTLGVALGPEHGKTIEVLSQHAEMACISAEKRGLPYLVFDRAIAESNRRQAIIARSCEHAFTRGELEVHYQPQIDLSAQRPLSAEALIRWTHPELGSISPLEFLPTFERHGLIERLTEFVLETGIRDWQTLDMHPLNLSINLPPHLVTESFCEKIIQRCASHDFPCSSLTLELTEQRLPQLAGAISLLRSMQQHGFRIAIDDFGVGQSSLARIGQIQFDELKIDRSLVIVSEAANNQPTVIKSIVSLARALNMKVVAEGVETQQQLDMLNEIGCDRIQGYLFARPMPFCELRTLLQAG